MFVIVWLYITTRRARIEMYRVMFVNKVALKCDKNGR